MPESASWGGVSVPGGRGSAPRGKGLLTGGMSARRGVCSGRRGVSALGGLLPGGSGIPACTEADPPVNRITDTSKNITLAATSLRLVTRKHSNRMCIARLETYASVSVATTRCHSWGGPKFEQV